MDHQDQTMSGKNIGIDDVVKGAVQLASDCLKNKRTVAQQLEWSNGAMCATMDNVIYKSDKAFFWTLRKERARLDEMRKPCTQEYVQAYNATAAEIGLPEYHVLEEKSVETTGPIP